MAKDETLVGFLKKNETYSFEELLELTNSDSYTLKQKLLKLLHYEVSSMSLDNNISKYKHIYKIFGYISTPNSESERDMIIESLQDSKRICEKRIKGAQSSKKCKNKTDVIKKLKDNIELLLIQVEYFDLQKIQEKISYNLLRYLIFDVRRYNYLEELINNHDGICLKSGQGKFILEDVIDKYLEFIPKKKDNQIVVYYYEKVIKLLMDLSKNVLSEKDILKLLNKCNVYVKKISTLELSKEEKEEMLFFINETASYLIKNDITQNKLLNDIYDTFNTLDLKKCTPNDRNSIAYYFDTVLKIVDTNTYSIDVIHKLNAYMDKINDLKIFNSIKFKIFTINVKVIKYINELNKQYKLYEYLDYKYAIQDDLDKNQILEDREIILRNNEKVLDCTDKYVITIDHGNTTVYDDALSLEVYPDGTKLLGIYLADATSFVKRGSQTDIRALNLSETIYLRDRYISMFPMDITNLLTLKEDTTKRAIGYFFVLDKNNNIVNYRVDKCLINIKKNYSHELADLYIRDERNVDNNIHLKNLEKLSVSINNTDMNDYYEIKNLKRSIVRDSEYVNCISQTMIANYMVFLNKFIAKYFLNQKDIPFIYCNNVGYYNKEVLDKINSIVKDDYNYKDIVEYINSVIPPSFYSINNEGYKGLNAEAYCHATNPLRNYCSLEIQRLIEKYVINKDFEIPKFEKERLEVLSFYLNERMRMNDEYENEVMCLTKKIS